MKKIIILLNIALLLTGCDNMLENTETGSDVTDGSSPTALTIAANENMYESLNALNQADLADATRGFIAADSTVQVFDPEGRSIFDQTGYDFISGRAPPSVNPILWRQAKLNRNHGLFKVMDGVYQIRGYDLANLTIIEGHSGWIIVDSLSSKQTTAMALKLARKNLGEKPITGIIFTHSHVDHFGGALGILSAEEAEQRKVPIVAPEGFINEATSENVVAGMVMSRRGDYFMGKPLARSVRGRVDMGLGKEVGLGEIGILKPTLIVNRTPQAMTIDGVQFVFQNVPGSEAPAELTLYLPEKKAFCGGEIINRTLHNIYTLRGAKTRDALVWSRYIDEALQSFGDAEVYFGTHHWPMWGQARIADFLKKQRDTYKYIHDQTLRLANQGLTPLEIADQLTLPATLQTSPSSREYYGTVKHNARAVYNFYFGYFDANPAHLDPLPPTTVSQHYLEFMGGADNVLAKARAHYEKGNYRWVAEVLNHVIFAKPEYQPAKTLLAETYDQLGYQAESAVWRNFYLTGAHELRHGNTQEGTRMNDARQLLAQTPVENFLDAVATHLNGPEAEDVNLMINMTLTDIDENYVLWIENSVLHHRKQAPDPSANATLNLSHALFLDILLSEASVSEILFSDDLSVEGSRIDLLRFFALIDPFDSAFNIIEP